MAQGERRFQKKRSSKGQARWEGAPAFPRNQEEAPGGRSGTGLLRRAQGRGCVSEQLLYFAVKATVPRLIFFSECGETGDSKKLNYESKTAGPVPTPLWYESWGKWKAHPETPALTEKGFLLAEGVSCWLVPRDGEGAL